MMAPTKKDAEKGEKEAKLTPDQSCAVMLEYLRRQNRPYSATDISANLKNRVAKAAAAKLLKDMHERGEIEGRTAGKQIVYHAIQHESDQISPEEASAMAAETERLKEAAAALRGEEKQLRHTLRERERSSRVSVTELKTAVEALEQQKAEMTARLAQLRSGALKPVSQAEREKADFELRKWQRTANARKKIRDEMWAEIEQVLEKEQVEETKEALGLEF